MKKISIKGTIQKMESILSDPVEYHLPVNEQKINMNELINQTLSITYHHEIYCVRCGKKTSKSFFHGFCYPCFTTAPEAAPCIIHPEKCQAHEGIARDMEWSQNFCLQQHYVYLAITNGLKVGVTRATQVPTRWIDQGAVKAVILAKTPNRHIAGTIEVMLKNHFNDKTYWQQLLNNDPPENINLAEEKNKAIALLPEEMQQYMSKDNTVTTINFPFSYTPEKIKSTNFDKASSITGILTGIKGQYLVFDNKLAINIRRHNGHLVEISVS